MTCTGEKASEEIRRLLATLMVLFVVLGWTRSTFVHSSLMSELRGVMTCQTMTRTAVTILTLEQRKCSMSAARYVIDVESRRPLVYSVLQLGHSWIDVVCSFLGEQPEDDSI